jgi:two-component system, LytTR family, sensor kinase
MAKLFDIILRYKLLHIVFWCYEFISLSHGMKKNINVKYFLYIDTSITTFFKIIYVYVVIYIFVPRILEKKKYFKFFITLITCLIATVLLTLLTQDVFTLLIDKRHLYAKNIIPKFLSHLVGLIIVTTFFLAICGLYDKYMSDRKKEKIEQEKLRSELQFLINQLNPHFLFNAINNICLLIKEDKNSAEKTLIKFSELLRYQLYDCSVDKIPLHKELMFIENYIDLEKIRCNQNLIVRTHFGEIDNMVEIAPFILLTFVENAFKHKSNEPENNFIEIFSALKQNVFVFKVSNSTNLLPEPFTDSKGIGLQNVTRRLKLLYEGKHTLITTKDNNVYSVELKLILRE